MKTRFVNRFRGSIIVLCMVLALARPASALPNQSGANLAPTADHSLRRGLATREGFPGTPASLFLGRMEGVDLDDPMAVFGFVFARLDREVVIYPTENYLYLRFLAGGQEFKGNIRLSVKDRDDGFMHFSYYEVAGQGQNDGPARSYTRRLGLQTGVDVRKIDAFRYFVRYGAKGVTFLLNRVDQSPPQRFALAPSERLLFRLHDESNFRFFLVFDEDTLAFHYILDEEYAPLVAAQPLSERILVDRQSGFAFYVDTEQQERKILVGVRAADVRANAYYDGPFDQLADNYIDEATRFDEAIAAAYPKYRDTIDRYGHIDGRIDMRVAIATYLMYDTHADLIAYVATCEKTADHAARLACLTDEMPAPADHGFFFATSGIAGSAAPISGAASRLAGNAGALDSATGLAGNAGTLDSTAGLAGDAGTLNSAGGLDGDVARRGLEASGGPPGQAATSASLAPPQGEHDDTMLIHQTEYTWFHFSGGEPRSVPDTLVVHMAGTTWQHFSGGEPRSVPDTLVVHMAGTTWRHFSGGEPRSVPDTLVVHMAGTTWRHFSGGEPGTVPDTLVFHQADISWRHFSGGVPGAVPDTMVVHLAGATWRHFSGGVPGTVPDTLVVHMAGTTWQHFSGGEPRSVPDTLVVHMAGTTWRHFSGGVPGAVPDTMVVHLAGATWRHFSGGVPGAVLDTMVVHMAGTTWRHFSGGQPGTVPDTLVFHQADISWQHFSGGVPGAVPDTMVVHLARTTWQHFSGGEPGSMPDTTVLHLAEVTWRHFSGGEPRRPRDTLIFHLANSTWRHFSGGVPRAIHVLVMPLILRNNANPSGATPRPTTPAF